VQYRPAVNQACLSPLIYVSKRRQHHLLRTPGNLRAKDCEPHHGAYRPWSL